MSWKKRKIFFVCCLIFVKWFYICQHNNNNMNTETIISKHLRFTATGTTELVTWFKSSEGKKRCTVAEHIPTLDQLMAMKADKYQELTLSAR